MRRSWLPAVLALAAACSARAPASRPSFAAPEPDAASSTDESPSSAARVPRCKQRTGSAAIIGQAQDADTRELLQRVTVVLQSTEGWQGCYVDSTVTDYQGSFTFDELPTGDYCVDFYYADESVRKLTSVARGQTAMVNVSIAPDGEPPQHQPPCGFKSRGEL